MGIFFRKQPTPRRFNYKPIYWDPRKEEREERAKQITTESDNADSSYKIKLQRGSFKRALENSELKESTRTKRKANIGLVVALILLLLLVYLIVINGGFWSLYFE
jgi:Flp pilus assembly protein TadB